MIERRPHMRRRSATSENAPAASARNTWCTPHANRRRPASGGSLPAVARAPPDSRAPRAPGIIRHRPGSRDKSAQARGADALRCGRNGVLHALPVRLLPFPGWEHAEFPACARLPRSDDEIPPSSPPVPPSDPIARWPTDARYLQGEFQVGVPFLSSILFSFTSWKTISFIHKFLIVVLPAAPSAGT